MKKLLAFVFFTLSIAYSFNASAGQCYWVCNDGEWIPVKNGVCIMPPKPVKLCPIG